MTVPSGDRSVAEWGEQIDRSLEGARGAVLLLSPNPMHDTGGGQRSAQIALELIERDYSVMMPLRRTDQNIFEYACHEGNIGMHGILAGARRLESQGRELRP